MEQIEAMLEWREGETAVRAEGRGHVIVQFWHKCRVPRPPATSNKWHTSRMIVDRPWVHHQIPRRLTNVNGPHSGTSFGKAVLLVLFELRNTFPSPLSKFKGRGLHAEMPK